MKNILYYLLFSITPFFMAAQGVQTSPEVIQNGFRLKTVVNGGAPTIQTGQTFSYLVTYSIPETADSAVNVSIQIPNYLLIRPGQNGLLLASCNNPVMNVDYATNRVSTIINPTNGVACSGTMEVQVGFRAFKTCNGNFVDAVAQLNGGGQGGGLTSPLVTSPITITASATNPWCIGKSLIWYQNSHRLIPLDGTATYDVRIGRSGTQSDSLGIMGLKKVWLNDDYPANSNFTGYGGNPNTVTSGMNVVNNSGLHQLTWDYNSAIVNGNGAAFYYNIQYPQSSFPANSQPVNTVTMTKINLADCADTLNLMPSICTQDTAKVLIVQTLPLSSSISKTISNPNPVPGCNVRYTIHVRNTGVANINTFSLTENIPTDFKVTKLGIGYYSTNFSSLPGSCNITVNSSGGSLTQSNFSNSYILSNTNIRVFDTSNLTFFNFGDDFTFSFTDNSYPILSGTTFFLFIDGVISTSPNSTFQNCVTLDSINNSATTQNACINASPGNPVEMLCFEKSVVNPQPIYQRGNIVNYQIKVKSIGTAQANVNIDDILSNGLTYNMANLNATYQIYDPVTSSYTPISGSYSYNSGTRTLSFSGMTLPSNCLGSVASCDTVYSNIAHVLISFNLEVANDAPAGLVPNVAKWSNKTDTAWINVAHFYGYEIEKFVRKVGSTTWQQNISVTPGTQVEYLLKLKNTSTVPLTNVLIADVMPRTPDRGVLSISPRSSNSFNLKAEHSGFTVRNDGVITTVGTDYNLGANQLSNPEFSEPEFNFTSSNGCTGCSPATWLGWSSSNVNNFKLEFLKNIEPNKELTIEFKSTVAATDTVGKIACNTFAANVYWYNGTGDSISLLAIESNPVCVELVNKQDTCMKLEYKLDCNQKMSTVHPETHVYTITINNPTSGTINIPMTSTTGVLNPSIISAAPGSNTYVVYYSPTNTIQACIAFGTGINPLPIPLCVVPTACVKLPICGPQLCMTAIDVTASCGNIVNNVQTYVFTGSVNNYNSSTGNLTITPLGGGSVNILNPTMVPANTMNQSFSFNYTPSVDASSYCFLVTLSSPTFKCIDTICFKTPNCPPTLCCEGVTIDTKQKECCSKLNIGKCEVKSIEITLSGGTIDNIDIANCADPIPGSYQGMSHYIITGCFNPQSVLTCVKANQGVSSVVLSYIITFVNGEVCKREDKVMCGTPPPSGSNCCPTTTVVPTCTNNIVCFSFTSSPFLTSVCGIILSVNPSTGVNSTSLLDANNYVLAGSVNINGTTNFTGAINNHIYFQLNMPLTNPQSTVTIRYLLCSGDTCDAEIFTIGGISANKVSVALTSVPTPAKLFATSFQLDVSKVTNKAAKVKTISILPENDNEQSPLFFSITGAEQFNDKNNALIAFERTLQGSKTANFILQKPLELINFQGGQINIVTYRKVERYKVVMFDENNSIISEFSFAPLFTSEITATKELKSNVQSINLSPNPTSEQSILSYTLKENQNVKIDILDMSGKLIKSLDNGFKNADTIESIEINTENLVSGVYLVRMILGNNNVVTEKLVVTH